MFRSPSGRKLSVRARAARRFALVLSLFAVAASLPFIDAGAWQQENGLPRGSQTSAKGQGNIIDGAEFVPGEVLVRFRSDAAAKSAELAPMSLRQSDDGGLVTFRHFEGSDIVRGLRLASVDAASTLEAVAELASRPDVLYAEPNYVRRKLALPNDPGFKDMWALRNIGQTTPIGYPDETAAGIPGVDIDAESAWNVTQGSESVVVGIVDEGIDFNHPDLAANIWTNPSDDADLGFPGDIHGWDFYHNDATVFDNPSNASGPTAPDSHGTHVAGTIGAVGNNGRGVTGVNWRVKLMSLKILGPDDKTSDPPAPSNVALTIRAYSYAKQMRERWRTSGGTRGANLRVLNNSYGGSGKSQAELDSIKALAQENILFVAASGNDTTDNFSSPKYPSNYDATNLISVAATDHNDKLASYSNYGARAVSIGAPGSAILSTTPGNSYAYFWGTSMAAPHVTGAAALICAANPNITLSQLRGALAFTGDRVAALDGKTTTGRRLNVANAVASGLENDATPPATAGNLSVVGQTGRSVSLAWTAPGDDGSAGTAADYDFFFVNPTTQARVLLPTSLVPAAAGSQQTASVDVPFRNFSGTIQLRAYDNAGNSSTASVAVSVEVNSGSDPYVVGLSAAQPLTTDTATNLFPTGGDDEYTSYTLPSSFSFPFYGVSRKNITVSSNGALYFSTPPERDNGDADDADSSAEGMQGQSMIAGLWDDIDLNRTLRPDSGVYVTQPDASRIVFRWQGIPCNPSQSTGRCTGGSPVNFEIELRNDGTIQMRYGQNPGMFSVVGISGGEPDAYVVASHTSESQRLNLTGAQTVTFSPRSVPVFSISGSVRDANGVGVPDVSIHLNASGQSRMTTTNSSGNYSFNGLPVGLSYNVSPSHPNYRFTPSSIDITNLSSDQGANFVATSNTPTGTNSIGFAQASYQYGEGDGRATFQITRSGDTSGAATLDYRTTDSDTFSVGCADPVGNQGGAFARCDFAATVGKLSFGAGEKSKTVTVPIIDDGHDEGAETFQLQLSNPVGTNTSLGAQSVATVTLEDNDTGVVPNPVTNSITFFVRQHYLDFLSREPEPNEPWSGVMMRCANINTGPEVLNTDCDRIAVSRAFLESPEFNVKGFYAFRFYKLAFNRLPQYTEIVADMSFVAGATEAEVYARKAQLATAFAARQEFVDRYSGMSNAQYVSSLLARYALTSVTTPDPLTPDSGTRVTLSVAELTGRLDSNLLTRAQVFRAVADSDQVQAAEFNSAFIAMQYYGYLRRTPEDAGYQANLNALQRGTSRREMVNAFLNSTEYRLRFGQP
jgi:subtilisin family serine protease